MKYEDFGIEIKTGKVTGEYYTTCPKCSDDRKKKRVKCLSVSLDKQAWICHHCGWKGALTKIKAVKQYFRPVWTNNTSLSDKVVKWFNLRGISQKTLIDAKVTESSEWMPQVEKNVNCIGFNYFRNGELINTKFRDGAKNFKLVKDAELIFYNYDRAKETVIIVEGEIDCLSFIEAGITSVVSVPNGATKSENQRLDYLDNCIEIVEKAEKIILAVDNDEAGIYLRDELARRIGVEKCFKVDFDDCKDANEYLTKHGEIKLAELIQDENLIEFPIEGIVTLAELRESVNSFFENGLQPAFQCGIPKFDELASFEKGFITTLTGIPNHGKSDFLDMMLVKLALKYNWRFAIFSPENHPVAVHVSKLASKLIGKWFNKRSMNYAEKKLAEDFIYDHFYFIRPDNEMYSLEKILDRTKQLVRQYGINGLVLDPYNRIEHHIPNGMNETTYIGKVFDIIDTFKKVNDIHVFLVAHPTKIKKNSSGQHEIPSLYDIAGSSNFYNKSDIGICVYRNFANETTEVYIQKVKYSHWGGQGSVALKWNSQNGRYDQIGQTDYNNWLQSETTQSELQIIEKPEIPLKPNNSFDTEPPSRIGEPREEKAEAKLDYADPNSPF